MMCSPSVITERDATTKFAVKPTAPLFCVVEHTDSHLGKHRSLANIAYFKDLPFLLPIIVASKTDDGVSNKSIHTSLSPDGESNIHALSFGSTPERWTCKIRSTPAWWKPLCSYEYSNREKIELPKTSRFESSQLKDKLTAPPYGTMMVNTIALDPNADRGEAGRMNADDVPDIFKDGSGNVLTEVEQWLVGAVRSPGFLELKYTHIEYGETVQRVPTVIRVVRLMDNRQKVLWRRPEDGTWTALHGQWSFDHKIRQLEVWFHCSGITAMIEQVLKFRVTCELPFTMRAHVAGKHRGVHIVELRLETSVNGSTWYLPNGMAQTLKAHEMHYANSVLLDYTREFTQVPPPPPGPPPGWTPSRQLHTNYNADISDLGFIHLSIADGRVNERAQYKVPKLECNRPPSTAVSWCRYLLILAAVVLRIVGPSLNTLLYEARQTYSSRGGISPSVRLCILQTGATVTPHRRLCSAETPLARQINLSVCSGLMKEPVPPKENVEVSLSGDPANIGEKAADVGAQGQEVQPTSSADPTSSPTVTATSTALPVDEAIESKMKSMNLQDSKEPADKQEKSDSNAETSQPETKLCTKCNNVRPLPTNPDVIRNIEKVTSGELVCCTMCHRSKGQSHDATCDHRYGEYQGKMSKLGPQAVTVSDDTKSAEDKPVSTLTNDASTQAAAPKIPSSEDKEVVAVGEKPASADVPTATASQASNADMDAELVEEDEEEEEKAKDDVEDDESSEEQESGESVVLDMNTQLEVMEPSNPASKEICSQRKQEIYVRKILDSKPDPAVIQLRRIFPSRPVTSSGPWSFTRHTSKLGVIDSKLWCHVAQHVLHKHWPKTTPVAHLIKQRKDKIESYLQRIMESPITSDPDKSTAFSWFLEAMWELYQHIGKHGSQGNREGKLSKAGRETQTHCDLAQTQMLQDLHKRVALLAADTLESSPVVAEVEKRIREDDEQISSGKRMRVIADYEDKFQSQIYIDEYWTSLIACRQLNLLHGSLDDSRQEVIALVRAKPSLGPEDDESDDELGEDTPVLLPNVNMPLAPYWIVRMGMYVDGRKHMEWYVPYSVYTKVGQVIDVALEQLGGTHCSTEVHASLWETIAPLPPTVRNLKTHVNSEEYNNWTTVPKRLLSHEFLHSVVPPQTSLALIVATKEHQRELDEIVKQGPLRAQPTTPTRSLRAYFFAQNDRQKISEHTLKCLLVAAQNMEQLCKEADDERTTHNKMQECKRTSLLEKDAEVTSAVIYPRTHMLPHNQAIHGGLTSRTMNRRRGISAMEETCQSQLHYCELIITSETRTSGRPVVVPIFAQLNPSCVTSHIIELIPNANMPPGRHNLVDSQAQYRLLPLTQPDNQPNYKLLRQMMREEGKGKLLHVVNGPDELCSKSGNRIIADPNTRSAESTWIDPLGMTAIDLISEVDMMSPRDPGIPPHIHLQRRYYAQLGKVADAGGKRLMTSERAKMLQASPTKDPEYFWSLCSAVALEMTDKLTADDPQCDRTPLEAHILLDPAPKWHRPLGIANPLLYDLLLREQLARQLALEGMMTFDQAKRVNDNITEHLMCLTDQTIRYRETSAFEWRSWLAELHGFNKETDDPWSGRPCAAVNLPGDGTERAKLQIRDLLKREKLPFEDALRDTIARDPLTVAGQTMMSIYHRGFGQTSVPNHHRQDIYRHTEHYTGPDDAKWESNHLDIPGSNPESLLKYEQAHRVDNQAILEARMLTARSDAEQRFERLLDKGEKPDVYAKAAACYLDNQSRHGDTAEEDEKVLQELMKMSGTEFLGVLSTSLNAPEHPETRVVFSSPAVTKESQSQRTESAGSSFGSAQGMAGRVVAPPVPEFKDKVPQAKAMPKNKLMFQSPAATQIGGEQKYIKMLQDDRSISVDTEVPTQLLSDEAIKVFLNDKGKAAEHGVFKEVMIQLCAKKRFNLKAKPASGGSDGTKRCKYHWFCGRFAKMGLDVCCHACSDTQGFADSYFGHTKECAVRCGILGSTANAYYFDERVNNPAYRKPYREAWKEKCVDALTTANGNIRKRPEQHRPKGWVDIPRDILVAYKGFAAGERAEPDVPWGAKLAKDYPRIEPHEVNANLLKEDASTQSAILPTPSNVGESQSTETKGSDTQASQQPKICKTCGIFAIHPKHSISKGQHCCERCSKTNGGDHGRYCERVVVDVSSRTLEAGAPSSANRQQDVKKATEALAQVMSSSESKTSNKKDSGRTDAEAGAKVPKQAEGAEDKITLTLNHPPRLMTKEETESCKEMSRAKAVKRSKPDKDLDTAEKARPKRPKKPRQGQKRTEAGVNATAETLTSSASMSSTAADAQVPTAKKKKRFIKRKPRLA